MSEQQRSFMSELSDQFIAGILVSIVWFARFAMISIALSLFFGADTVWNALAGLWQIFNDVVFWLADYGSAS